MIQVELIRHGETVYHTLHQYLGRLDAPLSERGETLLKEDDRSLRKVYVSCRKRAIRTAQLLFPRAELIIVPGIEEMDFGVFEGRSADEMADDDAYRSWVESGCLDRCPGGEKTDEFSARVCDAFRRLLDEAEINGEEQIVIVSHGGTMMAVMERFCLPHKPFYEWMAGCGEGFLLEAGDWSRQHKLRFLGYTSHAAGTGLPRESSGSAASGEQP